jgi:hypothetical protein
MMVAEQPPRRRPATADGKFDRRASLKTPPLPGVLGRPVDPVWLEPGLDALLITYFNPDMAGEKVSRRRWATGVLAQEDVNDG